MKKTSFNFQILIRDKLTFRLSLSLKLPDVQNTLLLLNTFNVFITELSPSYQVLDKKFI